MSRLDRDQKIERSQPAATVEATPAAHPKQHHPALARREPVDLAANQACCSSANKSPSIVAPLQTTPTTSSSPLSSADPRAYPESIKRRMASISFFSSGLPGWVVGPWRSKLMASFLQYFEWVCIGFAFGVFSVAVLGLILHWLKGGL